MNILQTSLVAVLAALFGAILNQSAQAQNNNFTNATSANWSAASAWSLGVPTSAQDAYHTNVTTGTVAINVTTAAQANSLTLGGSGGTASLVTFANQSLTVGGNITLASGAGTAELRLSGTNSTVTLNGGAGSIINGGGAGLATLNVQGGFSNSVGLLTASVDDLNMGQSGSGTLIITNGQTYNVSSLLRLNNSTASNNATILMNGGTLNYSGPNEIRLNSGNGAGNTAYLILNSNALVAATKIRRQNLGADAAIEWNDGTIGNYAGTNLTIDALAGTMNVKLAGTGTHTFEAESGRTITVAATAQLQDKSGEAGTLAKAGEGTLILAGTNTHTGTTTVNAGTLALANVNALQNSTLDTGAAGSQAVAFTVAGTNTYNLGGLRGADGLNAGANSLSVGSNNTNTDYSGALAGSGGLTKTGVGTFTLSGSSANTLSGNNTVSGGTLQLNKVAGVDAIAGNLAVASTATLLLSASGQVADTSAVTLSGGTIRRGGNVSEVFGNLNVTAASFLDFGAANAAGTLSFGTYTASALLTVQNFLPGNKLQFASGFDAALLPTGGNLSNANFSFSNGFTTGTEGGYFTITAIPEPSTYLAAAGLLALFLWPLRRRTAP